MLCPDDVVDLYLCVTADNLEDLPLGESVILKTLKLLFEGSPIKLTLHSLHQTLRITVDKHLIAEVFGHRSSAICQHNKTSAELKRHGQCEIQPRQPDEQFSLRFFNIFEAATYGQSRFVLSILRIYYT